MLLRAEALKESPYEIVAITCTYGNTKEKNVENNVIRILSFANRTDIPVYRGAKRPLLSNEHETDNFFGNDGFGDSSTKLPRSTEKTIESKHASLAMVELAKKYEGNISIVVLGPTTNVALAASVDNDFVARVKKFHVMGASVDGRGNYKANVEFNFGADPESNSILLSFTKSSQLILLPWEAADEVKISKAWRVDILGKKKSPYIKFINVIENVKLKYYDFKYYSGNADSMTVATMLWPHIVKSSFDIHVHPFDGVVTNKNYNARIIRTIDTELFKKALMDYLSCEIVTC